MDRLPKNFPRAFAFGKRIASDSMQQSTFEASTLHTQLDRHPVLRNLTKSIATCTGVRGIPHLRLTTHELTSVLGKAAHPGAETRVFTEPGSFERTVRECHPRSGALSSPASSVTPHRGRKRQRQHVCENSGMYAYAGVLFDVALCRHRAFLPRVFAL